MLRIRNGIGVAQSRLTAISNSARIWASTGARTAGSGLFGIVFDTEHRDVRRCSTSSNFRQKIELDNPLEFALDIPNNWNSAQTPLV